MDERSRKKKQMPNRRKCMSDEELEIPVSEPQFVLNIHLSTNH